MSKRIAITVGEVVLEGVLNGSATAEALRAALPLEAQGSYWGDELYFPVPVQASPEPDASDVVEPGAIAFWPPGSCLCLFWGPTPASHGDDPAESDGFLEALQALFFGSPLAIRPGELRTERDEPLAVAFDHRSELVGHADLPFACTIMSPSPPW